MQSNRIEMHYYTYAYLREDRTPYYIGKGTGNRIYSTNRRIKPPKDKSKVIYLKQNLTEEEAFRHEIYMIAVFGRKDLGTGILQNLTDGGEGVGGRILSQESRRKISASSKGKTFSEEHKMKIGAASKGRNTMLGKTHSEETRKKMSEERKGKTFSEETKMKMSEARKGEKNHNYGKTHSEETKRKIGFASKGRKWWNDGCGNCKMMIECPGNDWKLGRK
jgi:hypothetical protein